MKKVQLEGIYCVTPENQELFFDLWDEDQADPNKIAQLREMQSAKMIPVHSDDNPYYPNPTQEPDTEQWLWANPNNINDPAKMVGLFMDVEETPSGDFIELPRRWIMGQSAAAMIVYKLSCCSEYSVLMCAKFSDGFDVRMRDSVLTHDNERQVFAGQIAHDATGADLGHAWTHILNRDGHCHHTQKPDTGSKVTNLRRLVIG